MSAAPPTWPAVVVDVCPGQFTLACNAVASCDAPRGAGAARQQYGLNRYRPMPTSLTARCSSRVTTYARWPQACRAATQPHAALTPSKASDPCANVGSPQAGRASVGEQSMPRAKMPGVRRGYQATRRVSVAMRHSIWLRVWLGLKRERAQGSATVPQLHGWPFVG